MESEKEIQEIIEIMINDREIRSALTTKSFRFFFGAYFSHYIRYGFAPFHLEMFQMAEDDKNRTIVIMAARNSAKSAIMNTALSIWSVLGVQQKKFVVIASKTQQKAKQHYTNAKKELEANRLLRSDLGPFKTDEAQWGSSIVLTKYDAQITFASAEQSLRGLRYKQHRIDLLIADDIEDSDSVRTIDGRNATYDWLTNDAIPAGDLEKLRVILLGTLLHEDSIMMRFKNDIIAGRRDGIYREYPLMDASGNTLWKEKYPNLEAVENERLQVGNDRAWAQEFLLRIVSDSERVVHPEWIHYEKCPEPDKENGYRGTFIGIDPAISEDKKAACTAMVAVRVFDRGDEMKIYVLPYPVNERIGLPAMIEKAKYLSKEYGDGRKAKIYVEDVGFQKGLVQVLQNHGYPAEGIHPQGDKRARLSLISHYIKDGTVCFAPRGNEEIVMQIVNFGSEKYMDLVDALSMIIPEVMNNQKKHHPFPQFSSKIPSPNQLSLPDFYDAEAGSQRRDPAKPFTAGLLDEIF